MDINDLLRFAENTFWDSINERHQQKGGVYKIIAVEDGKRVPVNRFLGTDNEGVLYIGKATSFLDRVIALKKSLSPNYKRGAHTYVADGTKACPKLLSSFHLSGCTYN